MSNQGFKQEWVRAKTGTSLAYEGDWHTLWRNQHVWGNKWNERFLTWLNWEMGTSHTNLVEAQTEYANRLGFINWDSIKYPGVSDDTTLDFNSSHWGSLTDPITGITLGFTRSTTSALYTDENGQGKYAAVNEAVFEHDLALFDQPPPQYGVEFNFPYAIPHTQNDVLHNEDHSQAAWANSSVTVVSGNNLDPKGTRTADRLSYTASSSHIFQDLGASIPETVTASVYLKYIDTQWYRIDFRVGADIALAWFDVQNGVLGSTQAFAGSPTILGSKIKRADNGFYRCELSVAFSASGTCEYRVWASNDDLALDGPLGEGYFWRDQVERTPVATPSIATTGSVSAVTITGIKPKALGYRQYPQYTQEILHSEDFGNGVWTTVGAPTLSTDAHIDPTGGIGADIITDDSVLRSICFLAVGSAPGAAINSTSCLWDFR